MPLMWSGLYGLRYAGIVLLSSFVALAPAPWGRTVPQKPEAGRLMREVFTGAWQLAQAAGRTACAVIPASPEALAVQERQLEAARTGATSMLGCGAPAFAIGPNPDAPAIARAQRAYLDAARGSRCALPDGAGTLEQLASAGTHLGAAAARTSCVIATWTSPLGPDVASLLKVDLAEARRALGAFGGLQEQSGVIDMTLQKLPTAPGEMVHEALRKLSESIETALQQRWRN